MTVKVKICGLSTPAAVEAAIAAGSAFVGFVHYPASPRHVDFPSMRELAGLLPQHVPAVAVLVDPDDAQLQASLKTGAAFAQLHGNETPARLSQIRARFPDLKLIKALRVRSETDIAAAADFEPYCDYLLFDAAPPPDAAIPGGNGITLDWRLLNGKDFNRPWFLSGGLTPANVQQAVTHTGAALLDVSSGVESSRGVKDAALIHAFIKAAQSV